MRYPRFRVSVVKGYPIKAPFNAPRSSKAKPGLSAHVLDSLHLYALVATYRSEDRVTRPTQAGQHGGSVTRGHAGAIRAAEEHAARLNEIHRLVLHRDVMRERRGLVG